MHDVCRGWAGKFNNIRKSMIKILNRLVGLPINRYRANINEYSRIFI